MERLVSHVSVLAVHGIKLPFLLRRCCSFHTLFSVFVLHRRLCERMRTTIEQTPTILFAIFCWLCQLYNIASGRTHISQWTQGSVCVRSPQSARVQRRNITKLVTSITSLRLYQSSAGINGPATDVVQVA